MLGQHGHFEKHCCYEPAVGTALIMHGTNIIPQNFSCDALVELIDIVPTLLELCDITIPKNIQGKSLIPLLKENRKQHRSYVSSLYTGGEEAMIRTPQWKFIYGNGCYNRHDGYEALNPMYNSWQKLF